MIYNEYLFFHSQLDSIKYKLVIKQCNVSLVITTSINNISGSKDKDHRKRTYINSITKTLGILPVCIKQNTFIVENNGKRDTYLDCFDIPVTYTDNNFSKSFEAKGSRELLDILHIIDDKNMDNEDILIKITGRSHLLNTSFIDTVIDNRYEYDAFVKFFNVCTKKFDDNDAVLSMIAMRVKYWKLLKLSENEICFERDVVRNIRNLIPHKKILSFNDLGLRCCFASNLRIQDV